MQKKRVFDDEWRAKRVFTNLDRKQKSTYAYKHSLGAYKHSARKSATYNPKTPTKQTQVVMKITGASRNFEALKAHIKYISRDGALEITSSEYEIFDNKEKLKELSKNFNEYYEIPTQSQIGKEKLKEK